MNILLIESLESLIACQFQTDMNNDFNDFIVLFEDYKIDDLFFELIVKYVLEDFIWKIRK